MTALPILRLDTTPLRRPRFVHFASAALVALTLAFAPAAPARADNSIDACINAVADVAKTGIEAAKLGPECAHWANPATADLFAAVVGIVSMLEAGGAFKGGSCTDFFKSRIAGALVAALAGAIGGNNTLSNIINSLPDADKYKAEIQQLANNIATAKDEAAANAAAAEAYDLLSNIPVLGQAISMLPCACAVAAAGIGAVDKLVQAGGDCADFAEACIGNPLKCARSLFESGWHALQELGKWALDQLGKFLDAIVAAYCEGPGQVCNWFGLKEICGCEGDPPPPQWRDCVGGPGQAGWALGGDVRDLGNGAKYSVTSNDICICPPTMTWGRATDGAWICTCPNPGEVQVAHGICRCPPGKGLLEGSCQSCPAPLELKYGACTCPVEGQHFIKIGTTYICSCPTGQATAGKKCAPMCTDVSKTLLADGTCCSASQVSSCGVCCPSGQKPDPKSGSCVIPSTSKPKPKSFAPLQSK